MIITTVIAIDVNCLGCIRCPSKSELLLNEFLRPESYNCFYILLYDTLFLSFFFSFYSFLFFYNPFILLVHLDCKIELL
jgi:hypothetical protein